MLLDRFSVYWNNDESLIYVMYWKTEKRIEFTIISISGFDEVLMINISRLVILNYKMLITQTCGVAFWKYITRLIKGIKYRTLQLVRLETLQSHGSDRGGLLDNIFDARDCFLFYVLLYVLRRCAAWFFPEINYLYNYIIFVPRRSYTGIWK